MEIKSSPIEFKGVTDEGIIEGYASTWGEPPDHQGDVVVRGAFTKSLQRITPQFFWQHKSDTIIGGFLDAKEDDHGLFTRWQLDLDTEPGNYAYKMISRGRVKSFSIGYVAVEKEFKGTTRYLKTLDFLENSPVTFPANERATITGVKNDVPFHVLLEQVHSGIALAVAEAKALAGRRAADGRSLNDRHIAAIEALLPEAKALVGELDGLRVVPPDAEAEAAEMAFRLQLARKRLGYARTA